MAGTKVTIRLTAEQQKQIMDATGKKVIDLPIEVTSSEGLSVKELDTVAGGGTKDHSV